MIDRVFLDHPRRVGESYGEHALVAARFGASLLLAGLACLVHAVIPSLFTHIASDTVRRLHARLSRRTPVPAASAPDWQLTYEI